MADQFTPEPVKGTLTHNNAAPAAHNLGVLAAIASAAAPTLVEGNQTLLSLDLAGNLRTSTTIAGNTESTPLHVRLSDGTNSIGTVDAPVFSQLSDGTDPIGVMGNPLFVTSVDSSGEAKISPLTHASLAAGASQTLAAPDVTTATTGYLKQVTVAASVRTKAVIQGDVGGTPEVFAVIFVEANETFCWKPGDEQNTELVGAAGNNYQVVITNMDNQFAADVYSTLEWTEIA